MFSLSLLILTLLSTFSSRKRDATPALHLWKAGSDVSKSKAKYVPASKPTRMRNMYLMARISALFYAFQFAKIRISGQNAKENRIFFCFYCRNESHLLTQKVKIRRKLFDKSVQITIRESTQNVVKIFSLRRIPYFITSPILPHNVANPLLSRRIDRLNTLTLPIKRVKFSLITREKSHFMQSY